MWFWQDVVHPDMLDIVASVASRVGDIMVPDGDALEKMAHMLPSYGGRSMIVYAPASHNEEKIRTMFELLESVKPGALVVCFAHEPPPDGVPTAWPWEVRQIPDFPGPA